MLALRRVLSDNTPGLRSKVIGIYTLLIVVNLLLWGLTLIIGLNYPVLIALGITAYSLGLRHAVDADHIAAIDNVTRKLMQEEKKPVAVGLFFSLGHSTIVFAMATLVAFGSAYASTITDDNSLLKRVGGLIGTGVSALFLFILAALNIFILIEIMRTFRDVTRGGTYDQDAIDEYLNKRGFFARIFRRLFKTIDKSWKMYPVGLLFGLGFDTATEIVLLGTAGFASGRLHLPFYVTILLPLLFAAGMSLADTTDGIMMLGAYGWAFVKPVRKLFYNMTITLISVLVALVIGMLETLSIIQEKLDISGGFWNAINILNDGGNSGIIGAAIIGIFVLSWGLSTIIYRLNRYDEMEARIATSSGNAQE
jgi:nickel/cobalt transporter (NiCoT) family protein